jgi:phage I-like protein
MFDPRVKPEDRKTEGYTRLELREDGLWLTDILFVPDTENEIREGKWPYLSGAIKNDLLGVIEDVMNIGLVGRPATNNAQPLLLGELDTMEQMPDSEETMNDNETIRTKVKPLRELMNTLGQCLNATQLAIGTYKDGPVNQLAQKMMSSLPDWVKAVGELVEQLDPEAEAEAEKEEANEPEAMSDTEEKKEPAMKATQKEEQLSQTMLSELYTFCSDWMGTKDVEEIRGKLRAVRLSQTAIEKKLSQAEQSEITLLVDKGIAEAKIPPGEKEEFLKLSKKELTSFLSSATPLFGQDTLSEKPVQVEALKRSNAPKTDDIPREYEDEAKEIFSRIS